MKKYVFFCCLALTTAILSSQEWDEDRTSDETITEYTTNEGLFSPASEEFVLPEEDFSASESEESVLSEENRPTSELSELSSKTTELEALKKNVAEMTKELSEMKKKMSFLNFNIGGSTKITWGINFPDNPFAFLANQNVTKYPIHGFDFENNLDLSLSLNNGYFNKKVGNSEDFAEISLSFQMKSIKPIPYDYEPSSGDYYAVNAKDQDGNDVEIFFPKNDENKNKAHLRFGNFEFILKQARLSNLLGIGFFLNYGDVTTINTYYGISAAVDVLKLNHDYFNHKFFNGKNVYYSFDYEDFDPQTVISESLDLWSDDMLEDNQEPHGISLGYDGNIGDNFHLLVEGGIASKDGFDAVENKDDYLDYGFFLKGEPTVNTENFLFSPKMNFGLAFQTDTKGEKDNGWGTFTFAFEMPIRYKINKTDYISIGTAVNLKTQFAFKNVAFMFALNPELNLLYDCLHFAFPIQYWYKDGREGFFQVENIENRVYAQMFEEHIFYAAFVSGFRSNKLFGDSFEYKLTNTVQATVTHSDEAETFIYEILRNEFNFYHVPFFGSYVIMDSISFYHDIGFGFGRNIRMENIIETQNNRGKTVQCRVPSKERWGGGNLFYTEVGLNLNFSRYMTVGLSINTPAFLLGDWNTIGNQNTYCTIKLWSEIRL